MAYDWAEANTRICEALGLDADNVTFLMVRLRRGEMPSVDVEFLWTDTATLATELQREFVLTPVTQRNED
jgi:hypothetical protein